MREGYEADASEIAAAIEEDGADAIIRRRTSSGPKNNPTVSDADAPVMVFVMDYENREIDGTRVLATDKKVILPAGDFEPALSDRFLFGGASHAIVRVEAVQPGGVVLLWELQVRR